MANIDRDLISNKTSCYIFDIDGCLANVDNIVLTKEEAYNKNLAEYNIAQEKYKNDIILYEQNIKKYEKGLITEKPKELVPPIKPIKYDLPKKDDYDLNYFYSHLDEAMPIGGILDLFITMALSKKVIILTGREEFSKPATLNWLNRVITERSTKDTFRRINFTTIFKPDKNNDSVEKFKKDKILELIKQYNIQLIIEDNPVIIEEFTKLGFLTLKPNTFFKDLK